MFRKALRYYHTLKYLKPVQLFYQVFYRIKPFISSKQVYASYLSNESVRLLFDSFYLINSNNKIVGKGHFRFLNLEYSFENKVKWDFPDYGKLWNYNLQYFDFLLDDVTSDDYKNILIEDLATAIVEGSFKLEPYPVSLRLINWILYYSKTGCLSSVMDKAIKIQTGYLRKNLEYHIQANHLLENFASLLVASYYLKDVRLFNFSSEQFLKQLSEQILRDGGHYEGSPMYHQIILSKLLIVYEIEQKQPLGNQEYLATLAAYIDRMFYWLRLISFQSGEIPMLNDCAPGIAPESKVLWDCKKKLNIISRANGGLSETGYRKFNTASFEIIIDAGNIKPIYQPSHAHSDILSFCLQYRGDNVIIDPGTSTYENNSRRELERSTRFHNTVTINNQNQSDVWASFRVGKRAKVCIKEENQSYLRAVHNGYLEKFKVSHQRSFTLNNDIITIKDELIRPDNALSTVKGECRFFFNYTVNVQLIENSVYAGGVIMRFENADKLTLQRFQQPLGFNVLHDSFYLSVEFTGCLSTKLEAA